MTKLTYYTGRHKNPKWIHYNKRSKKFCINRTIKNFRTYFGCYDTLEEAEHMVSLLDEVNWDKSKLKGDDGND